MQRPQKPPEIGTKLGADEGQAGSSMLVHGRARMSQHEGCRNAEMTAALPFTLPTTLVMAQTSCYASFSGLIT